MTLSTHFFGRMLSMCFGPLAARLSCCDVRTGIEYKKRLSPLVPIRNIFNMSSFKLARWVIKQTENLTPPLSISSSRTLLGKAEFTCTFPKRSSRKVVREAFWCSFGRVDKLQLLLPVWTIPVIRKKVSQNKRLGESNPPLVRARHFGLCKRGYPTAVVLAGVVVATATLDAPGLLALLVREGPVAPFLTDLGVLALRSVLAFHGSVRGVPRLLLVASPFLLLLLLFFLLFVVLFRQPAAAACRRGTHTPPPRPAQLRLRGRACPALRGGGRSASAGTLLRRNCPAGTGRGTSGGQERQCCRALVREPGGGEGRGDCG
uniref:Secreted protein n=1 Tax=Ixodes ricinus TaxID=34613 RepID=A0A6B0V943_IXORI